MNDEHLNYAITLRKGTRNVSSKDDALKQSGAAVALSSVLNYWCALRLNCFSGFLEDVVPEVKSGVLP